MRMMMEQKIIVLTVQEVRVCTLLAMERWFEKHGSIDQPNYAKGKSQGKLEHELLASVRANVCEYAVARHYNIVWNVPWYPNHLHPNRKALPDVGKNGEVRNIRTHGSIPFWEKDKGKFIFGAKVLDDEYFTKVELYPYFYADDYMKDEYKDDYINGWRVPVDLLQALTVDK